MRKPVESPAPSNPARRRLLQAAGAAVALPAAGARAQPRAAPAPKAYVFFNPAEAAFIEAAAARLVPRDDDGPGALEAGLPDDIHKHHAGAGGRGERFY